jgi:hypothetical protein
MASTALILGAGTNRIPQDEYGMRTQLTSDLFIQALAHPKLPEKKILDQMKVVFGYIARFWHISIEQLRERESDLEECYKPLTLLNGSNLLFLLEKHGHHAKIDLWEAKKTLAEKDK